MEYVSHYHSPLGEILLAADEIGLNGLWFEGQKYFAMHLNQEYAEKETEILTNAKGWLDLYFAEREPDFRLPLHMKGTDFQKRVWKILCDIPYGQTMTYGEIAEQIAAQEGKSHMSAQAVGGAVGRNAISIIVPCHRVLGAHGELTGYAGGLDKKEKLLAMEHRNVAYTGAANNQISKYNR